MVNIPLFIGLKNHPFGGAGTGFSELLLYINSFKGFSNGGNGNPKLG
jgi:hypothetical protein